MNVIAPIRAERGGKAWATSIYYPYQFASLYGRGTALRVSVDAPTYNCQAADDVSYLDVAGVLSKSGDMVTLFVLNRHLSEAAELAVDLTGFGNARLAEHFIIGGEGGDVRAANTADNPERIKPRAGSGVGVEDGKRLRGSLPPLSYHVLRLALT